MTVWKRLHSLFDTDDGGLYDIRLTGLDASGVAAVFDFLRAHARLSRDAIFWHRGLERDERVADYPNPARLVAEEQADEFHVLAQGLSFGGVTVPDLGVCVRPRQVTLDYRCGREWGEPQVLALFELLRQLVALSPAARVDLREFTRPAVERLFVQTWSEYCRTAPPGSI
jgi:hypothetical protein